MRFSKTTEYSIRILSFMAVDNRELFTAKYIYEQLHIPYKYLASILRKLADSAFIQAVRGRHGGYKMAKSLSQISIYDIVEAIEGSAIFYRCILEFEECNKALPCAIHEEWQPIREAAIKIFKNTTLSTLSHRTRIRK